jgi:epoxyqueuosine reductase
MKDYCGTCTKCIDACPTEALTPYQIDSRKCISYLTIELREEITPTLGAQTENWAYGCDICQQVCPWNSFSTPNGGDFKPLSHILEFGKAEWAALDEKQFKKLTKHSAMSRVKWDKMEQNLQNSQNQDLG